MGMIYRPQGPSIAGVSAEEVRQISATYASISDPKVRMRVRDFLNVLAQDSLEKEIAYPSSASLRLAN